MSLSKSRGELRKLLSLSAHGLRHVVTERDRNVLIAVRALGAQSYLGDCARECRSRASPTTRGSVLPPGPPWSSGTGAGVMKRIAALIVGGIVTSFLLELLIYPAICVS